MHNHLIQNFIEKADVKEEIVRQKHLDLLNSQIFLRDDFAKDHFCVYFAGVDLEKKKVLLGHHKKADKWLFNGGHLDKNETIEKCLFREIKEEWGIDVDKSLILPYHRLSITLINNPKQPLCARHYDLWHFVNLDNETFQPDIDKIKTEFHEIRWVNLLDGLKLTQDKNTQATLYYLNVVFSS